MYTKDSIIKFINKMGKAQYSKLKINKFWKNIFSNKPLIFIIAVLILAIIFSNKSINQYFKPTGSKAASSGQLTKLVDGNHRLLDSYKEYMLYSKKVTVNNKELSQLTLYNINNKSVVATKNMELGGEEAKINGTKVMYKDPDGTLVVNDFTKPNLIYTLATSDQQGFYKAFDLYGDRFVYLTTSGLGAYNLVSRTMSNYGQLSDPVVLKTINQISALQIVLRLRLEGNYVVWSEIRMDQKLHWLPSRSFAYNLATKTLINLPVEFLWKTDAGMSYVWGFDVYGDVIVASIVADSSLPGEVTVVAYQISTNKLVYLPGEQDDYSGAMPAIWQNKVVYRATDSTGTGPNSYETIKTYDLLSKLSEDIWTWKLPTGALVPEYVRNLDITNINGASTILAEVRNDPTVGSGIFAYTVN